MRTTTLALMGLAALALAGSGGAQIERLTLAEIVQRSDNAVVAEIVARRVFRVDHPIDGPELYFTTLTLAGRSLADDTPITVDVTYPGGFLDQERGVHNSEAPAADDVALGNVVVAFYRWSDNLGGGVAANGLYASHGGLYRTVEGPTAAWSWAAGRLRPGRQPQPGQPAGGRAVPGGRALGADMRARRALSLLAPVLTLSGAALLLGPAPTSRAYTLLGGSLGTDQRDFRVLNNFTDPSANDNQVPDPQFPGHQGAVMAIWKACVEWGSELHGSGDGDPHQPADLGSGGANFDPSFQGLAASIGGTNDNIHSELAGGSGGVLAYCESPISNGWRIRYYSDWTWEDGPQAPVTAYKDLQGVAVHEYGHALGLDHSGTIGATMYPSIFGSGIGQRSIALDDVAGVQAIYGPRSASKPRITAVTAAGGGQITLHGSGFSPTGNQVWFTNKNVTAAGADPTVRVSGLASAQGGTTLGRGPAHRGRAGRRAGEDQRLRARIPLERLAPGPGRPGWRHAAGDRGPEPRERRGPDGRQRPGADDPRLGVHPR